MTNLDSQKPLRKLLPLLISATLIGLPFYLIRCSSFAFCVSPIPFTLLEVLILATFFVWLIVRVSEVGFSKLINCLQKEIPFFIQIAILVFLLSGFINTFVSSTQAAFGIYKAYFIEPFLSFIVIFDYLKQTKNLKLVVWSLVGCGIWISLLTILNFVFHYNPANPVELLERSRGSAVFSTSNAVGLLIGPILVLLFGYFWQIKNTEKTNKNEIKLTILSIVILLFGILASGSRGAFLGIFSSLIFFFSYIFYFKLNLNLKKTISSVFIALIILVFTFIFLILININLILDYSLKNQEILPINTISRLCLWEGAVEIIKDKPIIGAGLSNFQQEHANNRTCSTENSIYPHNIVLNLWTEVGIFGLISFLSLSIYTFLKLVSQKRLNYLALGLAAVLVEIFVHGLVDVPYFKNDLSVLYWTILALSLWIIPQLGLKRPQQSH